MNCVCVSLGKTCMNLFFILFYSGYIIITFEVAVNEPLGLTPWVHLFWSLNDLVASDERMKDNKYIWLVQLGGDCCK